MSSSPEDRSLLNLLASLGRDVPELVRKEIELVKQEARRVLDRTQNAVVLVVLAIAFSLATVSLLLLAAVGATTSLLVAAGVDLPIAATLAALIVGLSGATISGILVALAARNLRDARSAIDETVGTLARDARAATEEPR